MDHYVVEILRYNDLEKIKIHVVKCSIFCYTASKGEMQYAKYPTDF